MPEDSWVTCPRCYENAAEKLRADKKTLIESWEGETEIEIEDFEASYYKSQLEYDRSSFITFRQNYKFYWAENDLIKWVYSGGCSECGLALLERGEIKVHFGKKELKG